MAASVVNLQPRELTPEGEARRLAAVQRYEILDTPPDGSFDRITAIAARLFCVPISIISLVDHNRIWFKSHHGLNVPQIDRGPGSVRFGDPSRCPLEDPATPRTTRAHSPIRSWPAILGYDFMLASPYAQTTVLILERSVSSIARRAQ